MQRTLRNPAGPVPSFGSRLLENLNPFSATFELSSGFVALLATRPDMPEMLAQGGEVSIEEVATALIASRQIVRGATRFAPWFAAVLAFVLVYNAGFSVMIGGRVVLALLATSVSAALAGGYIAFWGATSILLLIRAVRINKINAVREAEFQRELEAKFHRRLAERA